MTTPGRAQSFPVLQECEQKTTAEARPPKVKFLSISGLGENGLNIARLSTLSYCTVVIVITLAVALLTHPAL